MLEQKKVGNARLIGYAVWLGCRSRDHRVEIAHRMIFFCQSPRDTTTEHITA